MSQVPPPPDACNPQLTFPFVSACPHDRGAVRRWHH
jgi:hypothetical protein